MLDPILKAALRSDLKAFIEKSFETVDGRNTFSDNWHIDAIAHQLTRCYNGETKRLIITQPPRSLKSISSSVALVAWALGQDPTLRIICVSYSKDLALMLSRQCRLVMESDWYGEVFPHTRLARSSDAELTTTAGGGRVATSIDGTLTGRGADIIIIDDPLNATDALSSAQRKHVIEWYRGTLSTRLNDKKSGRIILTMQRLHEEDLAGHLLEEGGFEHLNLPAIAIDDEDIEIAPNRFHNRKVGEFLHPAREGEKELNEARRNLGTLGFSAQYMQQPLPAEGNLVKREWFKSYGSVAKADYARIVQSWDLASSTKPTADYSACVTAITIAKAVYVVDVWRGRKLYPDLRQKIIEHANRLGATDVLIEKAGPGESMLQELRATHIEGLPRPLSIQPKGDKAVRLEAVSAMIERGDVWLPDQAEWLGSFLAELLGFPNAKHDDRVDAFSQLLNWVRKQPGASGPQAFLPGLASKVIGEHGEIRSSADDAMGLFGGVIINHR
ncbi:MAG: phage terminase large subunit [Pseudomonadota bacterium]